MLIGISIRPVCGTNLQWTFRFTSKIHVQDDQVKGHREIDH